MTSKTSIGTIKATLNGDAEGYLDLSVEFKSLPWITRADILQDILIAVSDAYDEALNEGKANNRKAARTRDVQ